MTPNYEHSIMTGRGEYFDLLNPVPEMVNIKDIAFALSRVCRFGGHCISFYSVAQHSALACRLAAPQLKLEALLHDASEAYLGDVPQPLKRLLPDYREIERSVSRIIRQAFRLPLDESPEVKAIDRRLLALEAASLMHENAMQWPCVIQENEARPLTADLSTVQHLRMPYEAEAMFLKEFDIARLCYNPD